MEVPRLGVESELQLLAYTIGTGMQDPSHIFDLHHSSQQCQIFNPLNETRDQTHNLMVPSQIRFHFTMTWSSHMFFFFLNILSFFFLFLATPLHMEFQGRSSTIRFLTHWAGPGIKLASQCSKDTCCATAETPMLLLWLLFWLNSFLRIPWKFKIRPQIPLLNQSNHHSNSATRFLHYGRKIPLYLWFLHVVLWPVILETHDHWCYQESQFKSNIPPPFFLSFFLFFFFFHL